MKTIETQGEATIEFNRLNTRVAILFFFASLGGLVFISIGVEAVRTTLNDGRYWLMAIGVGIILLGAAMSYRYLSRIFRTEKIVITRDTLTIVSGPAFRKKTNRYDVQSITFLNYLGRGNKTDHPLKGNSFDYFGFETQEKVIAEVNPEGNLSFGYNGKLVRFGTDVYSWDAEKINELLIKITDGALEINNVTKDPDEEEYITDGAERA